MQCLKTCQHRWVFSSKGNSAQFSWFRVTTVFGADSVSELRGILSLSGLRNKNCCVLASGDFLCRRRSPHFGKVNLFLEPVVGVRLLQTYSSRHWQCRPQLVMFVSAQGCRSLRHHDAHQRLAKIQSYTHTFTWSQTNNLNKKTKPMPGVLQQQLEH